MPTGWPAASVLIDESVGATGNPLALCEGCGEDVRVYFARYLNRGESHDDRVGA